MTEDIVAAARAVEDTKKTSALLLQTPSSSSSSSSMTAEEASRLNALAEVPAGASVMEKTRQQHSTSLVVVASEAQRRKDTHRLKEEEERYIVVDILRSSQVVALVDGTEKKAGAALIESNRSSSSSSCPLVSEGERENFFRIFEEDTNRREVHRCISFPALFDTRTKNKKNTRRERGVTNSLSLSFCVRFVRGRRPERERERERERDGGQKTKRVRRTNKVFLVYLYSLSLFSLLCRLNLSSKNRKSSKR